MTIKYKLFIFVEEDDNLVDLVPVNKENIRFYKIFEKNYDTYLKNYLSRIYPYHYEKYDELTKLNLLFWNYILSNDNYIGSIWLEKEGLDDFTATLGIFICDEIYQGKGIGEYVIKQAIKTGAALLDIKKVELRVRDTNKRAINCYKKCGFQETNRFIKNNGIEVIQMELLLVGQ